MPKNKAKNLRKELTYQKSQAQKYKTFVKTLLETLSEELRWDSHQISELNLMLSKHGIEINVGGEGIEPPSSLKT